VWLVGCNTKAAADNWAKTVVRRGANVRGSNAIIYAGTPIDEAKTPYNKGHAWKKLHYAKGLTSDPTDWAEPNQPVYFDFGAGFLAWNDVPKRAQGEYTPMILPYKIIRHYKFPGLEAFKSDKLWGRAEGQK